MTQLQESVWLRHRPSGTFEQVGPIRAAELAGDPNYDRVSPGEVGGGSGAQVEVFLGEDRRWYWHRLSPNGQIVVVGGQGYKSKRGARQAAERENPGMPVVELEEPLPVEPVEASSEENDVALD